MAKKYSKKESDMEIMEKFCEAYKDTNYVNVTMNDIRKIEPEKIECFANMLRAGVNETYLVLPIKNEKFFDKLQIREISEAGIDYAKGRTKDNTVFLSMQNPYINWSLMSDANRDAENNIPSDEIRKYLEEASKTHPLKQDEIREESILKLSEEYKHTLMSGLMGTKNDHIAFYLEGEKEEILYGRAISATARWSKDPETKHKRQWYEEENQKRNNQYNKEEGQRDNKDDIFKKFKVVCKEENSQEEKERQYTEDAIFNNGDTSKWDRSGNIDALTEKDKIDLNKKYLDDIDIELK